jgi:FAD-dependent oxidoreductase domain-containing protein 1
MSVDVVVIGGGVVGCSTAVYLMLEAPGARVCVVEPDPTYSLAATPRASGGVRQLFTQPENILLSRHTLEVIREWDCFAATADGPPAGLGWRQQGYLFIAAPEHAGALRANHEVQVALGVKALWLSKEELLSRYPEILVEDLAGAVLSPDDGWLDPHAMLDGLRRKAIDLGARFVKDRVSGLGLGVRRVDSVELEGGETLHPKAIVNAAGVWAPELAAQAGMPVPVEPMRRFEHHVLAHGDFAALPFLKDPYGLAIRPEGTGLSVGLVDVNEPGGFNLDIDHGYFDRAVWPALARRLPGLDRLRLHSTTVGLYDQNRLDGNPVIGNWPGERENFYVATGFSGHGMMHALGVGRGLAELIVHGAYRSIDLTRLGYHRIPESAPYPEIGIR